MREKAVKFGASSNLVGVITEPLPGQELEGAPAVLFLNSGILHHAGASRLYVKLARRLTGDGFTCLRFDFAGVGDSEPRRDTLPFARGAVADAREAMDFVQSARGHTRFVLVGLCSGADMAYHIGLADDRVVGLAKLDPWVYATRRSKLRHYGPRLLSLQQWRHSISVRLEERRNAAAGPDPEASAYVAPEYRRKFPPREEVEAGLRTLLQRGARLYYFVSGDQIKVYNYPEQYRDTFPALDFGDRLTLDFQPESDHTVTGLPHQAQVLDAIQRWAAEGWGAGRKTASTTARPAVAAGD